MSAGRIGRLIHDGFHGQPAELVNVDEARVLNDLDVVRPEMLDVRSPMTGRLGRPSAADDLRLPEMPLRPKTAAALKKAVRSVQDKASQPLSVSSDQAERIFRLAAFLDAYERFQQDVDDRRQAMG